MKIELKPRIYSIDALRGFSFVWILGLDMFVRSLAVIYPNGVMKLLALQVQHVAVGVHFYDLLMPTFIFLSGCSFPFSLASREAKGWSNHRIALDILRRFFILTALGCILCRYLFFDIKHVSYTPLFALIGFAWAISSLSYLFLRQRWYIVGIALFAVHALIFALWPNAKELFDQWLVPWNAILRPNDPVYAWQGTIVPFGATLTAFIGCWAGLILKRTDLTELRKCGRFALAAIFLSILGALSWWLVGPAMKPAWNITFVLCSGAGALLMLALFHWLCDVLKFQRWAFVFKVIGMNALAIYTIKCMVPLRSIAYKYFTCGIDTLLPKNWGEVINYGAEFALAFLICFFLYRKKIFIKI